MTMPLGLPRPRILLSVVGLFAVLGFFTYGNSLHNQFVTWDDIGLIIENPDITKINTTTIKNVFSRYDPELYVPLTFVSYQADYALGGGLNSTVFHATNLFLHIANALLVAVMLYALLGSGWLCIGLGLLFLLHPLNTEAVAWASARKDVLSTLFFLLSLLFYLMSRSGSSYTRSIVLSVVLFALGLLSKVMVISLPVILVLLDWLEGRSFTKNSLFEKLPFFVLALAFGVVALFGKATVLASSTPWQKVLMAARSSFFYIWKFFVPTSLTFAYPYNGIINFSQPLFIISFVLLFCIAVFLWKIHRKQRLLVFAFLFYFITLLPTFTNFTKGGDMYIASDRYAYIPMIGLLLGLGYILQLWLESSKSAKTQQDRLRMTSVGISGVAVLFVFMASFQASTWKDSTSLYAHAIQLYPEARAAHHNLGMEYLREGNAEAAIKAFNAASAIKDDIRTRVNKGAALVMLGKVAEARKEYEEAIKMNPDDPDAYYGLGNIEYKNKNYEPAIRFYVQALERKPDYTKALNNLGGLYLELRQWDNAIEILEQSLKYYPDFAASHYNLAGAYLSKGMTAAAASEFEKVLLLHPTDADALAELATIRYNESKIDEAAGLLQRALQADRTNPAAHTLVERMKKDGYAE